MLTDKLVLIVDDDDDLREEIVAFLNSYLIKTMDAKDAKTARSILQTEHVDLLVCDIIMPGESGLELTKWVTDNKPMPIILLSALDDIMDRVTGLEVGADDYITKPFDPRELLARLKSILRRYSKIQVSSDNEQLYTLNNHGELTDNDGVIQKLRPNDAKLLSLLVQQQGSTINREALYSLALNKSWDPSDRSVDNIISRLRSILEEDTANPKIIITTRNSGYSIKTGMIGFLPEHL